jgi:hypothetical protein
MGESFHTVVIATDAFGRIPRLAGPQSDLRRCANRAIVLAPIAVVAAHIGGDDHPGFRILGYTIRISRRRMPDCSTRGRNRSSDVFSSLDRWFGLNSELFDLPIPELFLNHRAGCGRIPVNIVLVFVVASLSYYLIDGRLAMRERLEHRFWAVAGRSASVAPTGAD